MSSRIFNGPPIFLPTNELVRASQTETVVKPTSVTVTGGTTVGNVFHTDGDDFLDPDKIGGTTTTFGDSIKPVTSNTPQNQVINIDPFGSNPDSVDILTNTSSILDGILNGPVTFPTGNFSPVIVDPLQWRNPNGVTVFAGVNDSLARLFQGDIPGIIQPTRPNTLTTIGTNVTTPQALTTNTTQLLNPFGSMALGANTITNASQNPLSMVGQPLTANNAQFGGIPNNITVSFGLPAGLSANSSPPLLLNNNGPAQQQGVDTAKPMALLAQFQQAFIVFVQQVYQLAQAMRGTA